MQVEKKYSYVSLFALCAFSMPCKAMPWLDTGDMRLRHLLQVVSDAGLLDAPITTWPLSSQDIRDRLVFPEEGAPVNSGIQNALDEIKEYLNKKDSFGIAAEFRSKSILIRDFSGDGREKARLSYNKEWEGHNFDVRLKATVADKTSHPDDQVLRLDESYISRALGGWQFTVGRQSRWWGPGWDGSLILSNNARPIPSISLENISSGAFDNEFLRKYLGWVGPNKLHMFIGQLESDRAVPNAKLIGTRFTFKPHKSLEVGLNRTIQWGGDGQDESFSDLIQTIASVRVDKQDGSLGTVKGNQIAGLDFKWMLPVGRGNNNYSLYGQYIGEDRVDGSLLLGDETFLVGGSISGFSTILNGSWRTYLEAADTSAAWFKGRERNNIIYNHSTYQDGYRFLDVSMGHGIDSDGRIISFGAMLSQNNGNFWRTWLKHAKLNEDGQGVNPIAVEGKTWTALGLSLERKVNSKTSLNFGAEILSTKKPGKNRAKDLALSFGFSHKF